MTVGSVLGHRAKRQQSKDEGTEQDAPVSQGPGSVLQLVAGGHGFPAEHLMSSICSGQAALQGIKPSAADDMVEE